MLDQDVAILGACGFPDSNPAAPPTVVTYLLAQRDGVYFNLAFIGSNSVDDKKREALLQEASQLVMSDAGLLPLHFELSVWAMKKELAYVGRADQATLAQFVTLRTAAR